MWTFDPDVIYLNHGSFGPSPAPVQAVRRAFLDQLQRQPCDFFIRRIDAYQDEVCRRLGALVGATPQELVLAENSTLAMNVVAASAGLEPGDEVLVTDHEYGAARRIWEFACRRAGARVRTVDLPLPLDDPAEVVACITNALTEQTRVVLVSHVTSPTALILPVSEVCHALRERGVLSCIDGPHAVAMLPLDLTAIGCDYYAASCHKWLSAAIGSGFLYVHPERQATVQPVVVSWGRTPDGAEPSWRDEFGWPGTRDPGAHLTIPAAIDFLDGVGLLAFRKQTHLLAQYARQTLTAITGLEPMWPDRESWYGSMISLPLPDGDAPALQRALWQRHGIEVPVFEWQGTRLLRVSCHLYNTQSHIDRLAECLARLLREEAYR